MNMLTVLIRTVQKTNRQRSNSMMQQMKPRSLTNSYMHLGRKTKTVKE